MGRPLTMCWEDVWFAHRPVDPWVVAPTLPEGLTVDTRDCDPLMHDSPGSGVTAGRISRV
ncbi:DUF2071 domain-containing protein [Haloplanus litoreus]|uniref:DUF2071 domain-containing protein n=1 Tax=Haloplanus litoreus TaxID=767515 RepID=UPI00361F128D